MNNLLKLSLTFLVSFSVQSFAVNTDDYQMRVSWIKEVKALLQEVEKKPEHPLKITEARFIEKFKLIEEAWADSPYNCFFAGWPSTLKSYDGKKFCVAPKGVNSSYSQGSCKTDEIKCQPLLFGDSAMCVSFSSPSDKQTVFARCEEKFQKEKGGSYSYLEKLTRQEADELVELSYLAADVCEKGNQKGTVMCKKLMQKLPNGLKSIQNGWLETFGSSEIKQTVSLNYSSNSPVEEISIKAPEDLVCESVEPVTPVISSHLDILKKASEEEIDKMYEKMKDDFERSALCKPENVVNNPGERPSGVVLKDFVKEISSIVTSGKNIDEKKAILSDLSKQYKLSDKSVNEVALLIVQVDEDKKKEKKLNPKIEAILLKEFVRIGDENPEAFSDKIKQSLFENHIFVKNKDGEIKCPFVSRDAFRKAIVGRSSILNKKFKDLKNENTITIVDYSRPSNERRLFVLDLANLKVMHNTWVGQGVGGNSAQGVDGFGSSPKMSNSVGSAKSSEGFMIASESSIGEKWGPNVILKGIDKKNTNVQDREIVLHGWMSMMDAYNIGLQQYDYKTGNYGKTKDPVKYIRGLDFDKASDKEIQKAVDQMKYSSIIPPYLAYTAGCLGVSVANVSHTDLKGRNKTQLEVLREDLPGTLIMSYSGPEMDSKYFR